MTVTQVTQTSFSKEVTQSALPVLLLFSAAWCTPCQKMYPFVEQFAKEHNGVYKVCKVDITENPSLATRFGVKSAPTVLVFREGKVRQRHSGAIFSREKLLQLMHNVEN